MPEEPQTWPLGPPSTPLHCDLETVSLVGTEVSPTLFLQTPSSPCTHRDLAGLRDSANRAGRTRSSGEAPAKLAPRHLLSKRGQDGTGEKGAVGLGAAWQGHDTGFRGTWVPLALVLGPGRCRDVRLWVPLLLWPTARGEASLGGQQEWSLFGLCGHRYPERPHSQSTRGWSNRRGPEALDATCSHWV